MPKYKIFSMDHLLLPSLPTYYLIKTLKKWTALTNNSQREKEILKRLDRRGTNIGAVLGDEMVFWSFDDLSAFEVHRIEFKK
jgi:hypothetical protein